MPERNMKDIKLEDDVWKKIMNLKINKGFSSANAVIKGLIKFYLDTPDRKLIPEEKK